MISSGPPVPYYYTSDTVPLSSFFSAFPSASATPKASTGLGSTTPSLSNTLSESRSSEIDNEDLDPDFSGLESLGSPHHFFSGASLGSLSLISTSNVKQSVTPLLNLNSYGLSGFNSFALKTPMMGIPGPLISLSCLQSIGDSGTSISHNSTTTANSNSVQQVVSIPSSQKQQQQHNNQQDQHHSTIQQVTELSQISSPSTSSGSSSHFAPETSSPSSSTSSLVSAPVTISSTPAYSNDNTGINNTTTMSENSNTNTTNINSINSVKNLNESATFWQMSQPLSSGYLHHPTVSPVSPDSSLTGHRNSISSTKDLNGEFSDLSVTGSPAIPLSSTSHRNSVFFPDSCGSSSKNLNPTTTLNSSLSASLESQSVAIDSLTSPWLSMPSSAGLPSAGDQQQISKPSNNLVSLLDRFSNIGDITRSAEYAANDSSTYNQSSTNSNINSRHGSFVSYGSASNHALDIYGMDSAGDPFLSPFASPGPAISQLAASTSSSSPWNQPAVSLSSGSSTSTVVSPSLTSDVHPQQHPRSVHNSFASSQHESFDSTLGFQTSSFTGSPLPHHFESTNLSSARSPIFQSTYSSVFSSPVSSSSASINDGWQSPHNNSYQQQQPPVDDNFSYRSPVFNPASSLDYHTHHRRSPHMRPSPLGSRFSPQPTAAVTSEKTLRQQLAYHHQQQQKYRQDQFLQHQQPNTPIPSRSSSSSSSPLPSKFNAHTPYSNTFGSPSEHITYGSPSTGLSASALGNPSLSSSTSDHPAFSSQTPPNGNPTARFNTTPNAIPKPTLTSSASSARSSRSNQGHSSHSGGRKGYDHFTNSLRSPLLEEFRSNKTKKYELRDIYGYIVEFSGDQYGSRFIQSRLETASSEEKEIIFNELRSDALQLMTDVFGNYVIQKFFELGNQMQKTMLAKQMEGHILNLSLQMYGCRVIQKAIEYILTEQQARLIRELDGHVLQCIKDQNGNHVIQKAIERIPSQHIQFILKSFDNKVFDLATHAYGCRVIQRMLEYCGEHAQTELLKEIHKYSYHLIDDQYGNYVIQHVIERGSPEDRDKIINLVCSSLVTFSRHKFASNVVEKCIVYGSPDQRRLFIDKILDAKPTPVSGSIPNTSKPAPVDGATLPLYLMMKDQYANYVIQKLLEIAERPQRDRLIKSIKTHLHTIKKITATKHVAAVERILELDAAANGQDSNSPEEKKGRSRLTDTINNNTTFDNEPNADGRDYIPVISSGSPKTIATNIVSPPRTVGLPSGPAASLPKEK